VDLLIASLKENRPMKMQTCRWLPVFCAAAMFMAPACAKLVVKPPALEVGDPAPAIEAMAWIKGEPVKEFRRGHVYVVEFWATWCVPCVAVMPHLSELQRKHAEDLTIIGVNVRESKSGRVEIGAIEAFVTKKGEDMAYTVAMDDPGTDAVFNTYMAAAGFHGIPTSFIVGRDGAIAYVGYTSARSDYPFDVALSEALAARSDLPRAAALQARVNEETARRLYETDLLKEFNAARARKDHRQVVAEVDAVTAVDPDYRGRLFTTRLASLLHLDEAAAGRAAVEGMNDATLHRQMQVEGTAGYWIEVGVAITREKGLSKEAYGQAADYLQRAIDALPADYNHWLTLAEAQHMAGNDAGAIAAQERAIALSAAAGVEKELVDYFRTRLNALREARRDP
jgi:thiol-disulfide isomerase/thioredoxin